MKGPPRLAITLTVLACVALPSCTPRPLARPPSGHCVSQDGVSIHYEASGSGQVAVVFVHGWSCDLSYWRLQLDHFAARYRVVAVDLAGHGHSGSNRQAWTMGAFGEDVAAVVRELELDQAVLVGHSMGAPVIIEAAQRLPGRLIGLVAVDSLRAVNQVITPSEWEKFIKPLREDFQGATESWVRRDMFTPSSDPALIEEIATDMAAAPPDVAIPASRELFLWDARDALDALEVPIRAISSADRSNDVKAAQEHGVEVTLMSGVGHFVMMEDPKTFNRLLAEAIEAFLEKANASSGSRSRR